jgi:hypothetical protein
MNKAINILLNNEINVIMRLNLRVPKAASAI